MFEENDKQDYEQSPLEENDKQDCEQAPLEENDIQDYEQTPQLEAEIPPNAAKKRPSWMIIAVSVIGIILALPNLLFNLTSGLEALFMLTVIPLFLCLGLLIKKWWVCGLLYCIVFLAARINILLSDKITALAKSSVLIVIVLFAYATVLAYNYQKGARR